MEERNATPKVVLIGAGSAFFGLPTFRDIFTTPQMKGAQLVLVDIDEQNLDRMYALAHRLNEHTGFGLRIAKTTQRREALAGADFVISCIAIERCELWRQDFEIPKKYGIRHCLGENGGPGALFFGMRTIPAVMDIVHDMEELCPDAWFMNFSNPESRIVLAVSRYTNIKCIGLCHGIFMAQQQMARILGRDADSIEIFGAGMNHFQWILSVRDRQTGEDLYPEFREKEASYDPAFMPYVRKMYRIFGLYPTCSDDHMGEYQAYGYEAGEHGYDFEEDARVRADMLRQIDAIMAGTQDIDEWLVPSGEKAVEVLTGIFFNERRYIPSAIVYNDGAISQLPADVAVEIPVVVDANGVHKEMIRNMPDGVIGLMNQQVSAQRLSVLAALEGSKELALQALLCDPVINSTQAAIGLLEELFEINRKYIRKCR